MVGKYAPTEICVCENIWLLSPGMAVKLVLMNLALRLLSVVLIRGWFAVLELLSESLHDGKAIVCFAIVWSGSVCMCVRALVFGERAQEKNLHRGPLQLCYAAAQDACGDAL